MILERFDFSESAGGFADMVLMPTTGNYCLFKDVEAYLAAQVAEAVKKERAMLRLTEVDPLIGLVNRLLRIAANNRADQLAEEVLSAVRKAQEESP